MYGGRVVRVKSLPTARPILILVRIMALATRGAVFQIAFAKLGWTDGGAIFPAIAWSSAAVWLGDLFFTFVDLPLERRWPVIAIGVAACLVVFRLLFLGLVNLLPEEAYYWNYAQHIDIGYLDHPPMVAWLIRVGTEAFGNNEFGVRITALATWIAFAWFMWRLTGNLFGKAAGATVLLLVSVLPFFFSIGFFMTPDVPLAAAWAGTLFFLERALIAGRARAWWVAGIFLGFGLLSKYTIALLCPAALLFVLIEPKARHCLFRPQPYLAVAVALMVFSPVVYWNATHAWASFAFQGSRRLDAETHFSLPSLIGYAAIILTPTGLVGCLVALVSSWKRKIRTEADRERALFLLVFTLVPLSVFVAFSLLHDNKPNWTGPVWLAALPAVAAAIAGPQSWFAPAWLRNAWPATVAITLTVFSALFCYVVIGYPSLGTPRSIRTLPIAWDAFGHDVGEIQKMAEDRLGAPVVLIGMDQYFLASEMAFYVRPSGVVSDSSVGRSAIGDASLMYDYWYPAAQSHGKVAILVSLDRNELQQADLASHFLQLGTVQEQAVTKRGVPVGHFFFRVGRLAGG